MTHEERELRRYLLGELPEPERDVLERQFMTSDEVFRELLIAEDDLVDDYCAGELSEIEKHRFLSHFLVTGERRHQVRFAAALRDYGSAGEDVQREQVPEGLVKRWWRSLLASEPSVWRLSAAVTLAALLVGGIWMLREEMGSTEPGARGPAVASVFLTAGQLRSVSEPPPAVVLPSSAEVLELQLDLPSEERASYEVVLERADGVEVFSQEALSARTIEGYRAVVTAVPVSRLAPGDYRVILRGSTRQQQFEIVGRYDFRILNP